MIPVRLTLHFFLSHRHTVLDLRQIHTACICGANGAGKSALLEALTWGLWGRCRASNDEDVIHTGATEAQVEVIYECRGQTYRALRSRSRSGSSGLEWQIQSAHGWRSLTQKGVRATQQALQAQLRLDYETFINSAYLRQGRADEFTLKRASERKQILAEILKLGQYDLMTERCRERARTTRVQVDMYQGQLDQMQAQRAQVPRLEAELMRLQARQQHLQADQDRDQTLLLQMRDQEEHRRQQHQRYQELTRQLTDLSTTLSHTEAQWRQQQQQLQDLEMLVGHADWIQEGYQAYQQLLRHEQELNQQFQSHQLLIEKRQQLQAQRAQQQQDFLLDLQGLHNQLTTLEAQREADRALLREGERIEAAFKKYRQAQKDLADQEQRQAQALPLLAQRQDCLQQLRQEKEQRQARRDLLQHQIEHLQEQQQHLLSIQQAVQGVEAEIQQLEQQRRQQHQVGEILQQRRLLVHQLQDRLRTLERQWQLLQEQQDLLRGQPADPHQTLACPLCYHPLTDQHRTQILSRQTQEQQDLQNYIFVTREQLAVADREIEVLQSEVQRLGENLRSLDRQQQTRGRLQHQLETRRTQEEQLRSWQQEVLQLDQILAAESYAPILRQQLADLEAALEKIGYAEADYALFRSETHRWRWAENRWVEWHKAQQQQQRLNQELHQLRQQIQARETKGRTQIEQVDRQIYALDQDLAALRYDVKQHQILRERLSEQQHWLRQWDALIQAQEQIAPQQQQVEALVKLLRQQRQTFDQAAQELETVHTNLSTLAPVTQAQLQGLTTTMTQRRQQLDEVIAQIGAVQQQLQQLEQLQEEQATLVKQVQQLRRQTLIYQELMGAFGRNGIPALIIENVLPELESEANQILSRLTGGQLHLQFITQRSGRRSSKLIDTLDILIADARGTRPYETYSGGEAFRINFAIRLALSRLLTQRSGTQLQTLLIDEGFGSQDQQGRQHLVGAINAVASDFARILVITHIPSLRDAFPTRIEVKRGPQGSQLRLLD
ncbi:MAG: SMC family ATPase [Synechococcaceae cyanobacterium SM2_3_1]|nr:SMC family ATPase [Synechococcaceae cyanobacterium SM2_3_1]